ncbi:hypothetical protein ACFFV7_12060 [Nonomuraea spiralis]|uniref:Uncharacterized protein n=1 Tax=Nonomuraea spiralis TaxID=46182 RepID=A0ABV5IBM2_9ACTN|nr:hypothetical protein [Nonomuraea spiralis]GGS80150.1 hypothetical protein GCM10010176_024500 [Nonomuraea spiralis]
MSYEERGAWIYLVATAGTYAAYVVVVLGRAAGGPLSAVPHVAPMLWAIGIGIALSIAGRIVVETVKPSESHKSDVRDREINRSAQHVGGLVLGVSMMVPLGLTMAEAAHFWIANAIYAGLVLSALVATPVRLVACRRGL